jgi:hypothetical protein
MYVEETQSQVHILLTAILYIKFVVYVQREVFEYPFVSLVYPLELMYEAQTAPSLLLSQWLIMADLFSSIPHSC